MVDLIQRWVEEQISPWRSRAFDRDILVDMERQEVELFLFNFSRGSVEFKPKPTQPGWNNHRCQLYLSLFREAYGQFCPDLDFKLLLYPGDQRDDSWDYPVFSFLKHKRSNEILVPDVDFMKRKFYVSSEFTDPFQPYEKDNRAIFVGSTTGGHEITREKLESNSVPRIKSARFFKTILAYRSNYLRSVSTTARLLEK